MTTPSPKAQSKDPFEVFWNRIQPVDETPVPLKSTAFRILIEGGLTIVTTDRIFKNEEGTSIEATLTFPVPVHATLFSLEVKIGDRRLTANSTARSHAREVYEDGLERGKTSILHEEPLRGIHMLSLGHIQPGTSVEVTTQWVMPLAISGGQGHLRIPTTVGQIYGQTPLEDGDDFTWTSTISSASVSIESPDSKVTINGQTGNTLTLQVPMNRPIDVSVSAWTPRQITGRTVDGSLLELLLTPALSSSDSLDVAILVDHSGSMGAPEGELFKRLGGTSTHERVVAGLRSLSQKLNSRDSVDLWEFNTAPNHVGRVQRSGFRALGGLRGNSLATLADRLSKPSGGTEIGTALETVLSRSEAHSILLITDGKSHALKAHDLARWNKRISVILIGEDSLEAQVGYLAALTGGDIFIASKDTVDSVFTAATDSLRGDLCNGRLASSSTSEVATFTISGATIRFSKTASASKTRSTVERAVAALFASLSFPHLSEADATELAQEESLVSHLTSLVLVDEEGAVAEGIPTRRRVPLEDSLLSYSSASIDSAAFLARSSRSPNSQHQIFACVSPPQGFDGVSQHSSEPHTSDLSQRLDALAVGIDWNIHANDLIAGLLDRLDEETIRELEEFSQEQIIRDLALQIFVDPLRAALILIAQRSSLVSRPAMRALKALSKGVDPQPIQKAYDALLVS